MGEYQQIMQNLATISGAKSITEEEARSFAFRLLIHYSGDIHQPLHATARVDHEYTHGDRGGNSFRLPMKESAGNLHAVYDSVFYEFTGYPNLPFNSADWDKFGKIASDLVSKYPVEGLGSVKDLDFVDWANDSFKIASTFTYDEINHNENKALPADYIAKGKTIMESQIVIAGFRLRYLIDSMFKSEEVTFLN